MWTIVSKVADVIIIAAASVYVAQKTKEMIKSGRAEKLYKQVMDKFKKDVADGKVTAETFSPQTAE
jgi:hypothetical protein